MPSMLQAFTMDNGRRSEEPVEYVIIMLEQEVDAAKRQNREHKR